ncbi:bifunctional 2-polyprenyl-6-hydroxyphenol methylase/3-demethylubiquinol 3-O-methyltransferase UbiG [Streptomyces sp. XD-27]|uniref:class I SAM-dependent methyltransferase n=1 Tax=Streptomyces sp. XD-27 TaxID=3062779 RepID=UPI0026F4489F|nr:class I SAM-dependent methyltransferase [Streptomyces sp. XD-27]WKX69692.1 class I SAM-dependent methyltransferase [Streptomyces sp. XD-27]
MTHSHGLREYWETTGAAHTFTHPLDRELLARRVPADARILDYGCGYGRLVAELADLGYGDVEGVDLSAALVARGRSMRPELRLSAVEGLPLPFPDGSFDAALLFAVLTCVPEEETQAATVAELARLVRPGGALYLSDVPLQSDERHLARYREARPDGAAYGVFAIADGGVFRHQDPERLRGLLERSGFEVAEERRDEVPTLDGHTVTRIQLVARRA